MKDWIKDKFYYKKKYNAQKLIVTDLKVQVYDLNQKLEREKEKNRLQKNVIEKVRKMPREIKKEYEIC